MDVVLLGSRSRLQGQVLEESMDGGGNLGDHDEGDKSTCCHFTCPVDGRAPTPETQT